MILYINVRALLHAAAGRSISMIMQVWSHAWLFQSISTAFFASLERCSCFTVDTIDDSEVDSDQYYSRVLVICNDIELEEDRTRTTGS